jgi:predicted Zn-dependent protease
VTFTGHYLDGRTAVRHPVTVRVAGAGLDVTLEGGATFRWPLGEIRQAQGDEAGDPVRFERGSVPETLLVDDPAVLIALRKAAPEWRRRFHDPRRRRARVALTALATAVVLVFAAALYVWGIPAASTAVAPWVPVAWEDRLGAAIVDQVAPAGRRCVGREGQAALEAMTRRLLAAAGAVPYRFRVVVADAPIVNALAAPGGHIVLFRGILEESRDAEELAGVLAHEMQHVLKRHTTRAILQRASTAVALTAVAGDMSGVVIVALEGAHVLGTMAYSRAHEAEADAAGVRMLLAAGVDPTGMIRFFDDRRGSGSSPALFRYLASHPPSAERAAALRRLAAEASRAFTPILTEPEWRALVRMCRAAGG